MTEALDRIKEHAVSIAERESCELYDLEMVGSGKNRVLRIYIDKAAEGGVTVEDCSNVSRALDLVLDVENLVPGGSYQLEVSSPGLERRLRQPWHFARVIGSRIAMELNEPLGQLDPAVADSQHKRKKLKGKVVQSDDSTLTMEAELPEEWRQLRIPYEMIKKAKLVYDFGETPKPKKRQRKN